MSSSPPTKVLLALTSHGELGDTGRSTGFYVPEAAHPHEVFTKAGYQVDFVSVRGGSSPLDGFEPDDEHSARFLADPVVAAQLADTPTADRLDPMDYTAVYFVGGHGTMWDFPDATELTAFAGAVYERGGVVAAVCHGPSALVNLRLSDGTYLVDGKEVAVFTNDEEVSVGLAEVVPFLLETRLTERGAKVRTGPMWAENTVSDGRLVTGQNPASAARVAELTVRTLASGNEA
ncbi:type 1 glutamine amidotransferase domain-containing protein [Streptomyces sp. IMTB 2501]|uniref:type 1 glutamine amidotransferase domain-containing protein n=1 Tax=Streptomyces sp. IMTB 2501 TaxID=1776340 RepID=UPI00096F7E13|nr:type 1 glutamine amidotransferase domain-containing protein [Streptomyces sp. IMTB 2501]OLZ68440.1 type 1 glutamine amidotransferase domain-containing protein [Streptomyces sp. IMTB 2501]